MCALVLVLLLPGAALAGPRHYLRTHIDLLAADAAVVLAVNADAASTVHCFHMSGCALVETNPLATGSRPSNLTVYAGANGLALGVGVAMHLLYHGLHADRHSVPLLAAPILLGEGIVTRNNVRQMQQIQ